MNKVRRQTNARSYLATLLIWGAATAACFAVRPWLAPENLVLVYLMAIAVVAALFGPGESVVACLLSVAAYDFFFVQPHFSFAVSDAQYLLTFAMMLALALLISGLSQQLRAQAQAAGARERRSGVLYALTRELAETGTPEEIYRLGAQEVEDVFGLRARVLAAGQAATLPAERQVLCLPLGRGGRHKATLVVTIDRELSSAEQDLLQTMAAGISVALERIALSEESQRARLAAETEHVRSVLLNSVSHDLRTPLTIINGAATAIAQGCEGPQELATTIVFQTERLSRHVQNLLDMTRLEAATVQPTLEWHSIEELIGSALEHTAMILDKHVVKTFVPPSLALIKVDGALVEKALINLLENAARHTPAGTEIEIRVTTPPDATRIQVADRGPGIPPGKEETLFEKFAGTSRRGHGGFGLGLAICRAVAQAHGGRAWAENRAGGGARFYLEFPASGPAPQVPDE